MFPRLQRPSSRALLVTAAVMVALAILVFWTLRQDPPRNWLLPTYLRQWAHGGLFVAASVAAGWRLLASILPTPPLLGERFTYAAAVGTLLFATGVFLTGVAGGFGVVAFYAWPAVLLAWGGPRLVRDVRRAWPRLRRFGARLYTPRTPLESLSAAVLLLSLVLIYLLVITPENIGWDARWYHLSVAEHYLAAGKIRAFGEGWYLGAYPQLASLLYTWAFQAPGGLFEHVLLAAHVEWFLFLATLPGIAALARRLLGGQRVPFAAAALFLFPGIFLYDSSLIVGADHVLAFFAPAIALSLLRLWRSYGPGNAALVALATAGAAMTKYQALYFLPPVCLMLLILAVRQRRLRPVLVFAGVALLATAPHWLKNLIFYGNPTYPLLSTIFPSRPFHPGAGKLLDEIYIMPFFVPKGTAWQKLGATLGAQVSFSFIPNDWLMFHGKRPVFGSLYTLLIPVLLFLRGTRRIWALVAACQIGIAVWYYTSHQDRFLQAILPWMAAVTAATLVLAWRQVPLARPALALLLLIQLGAGGDVPFLRTHSMLGDSPLKHMVDRIAAAHERRHGERFKFGDRLAAIGRELPRGSKVLVHDMNLKLGLGTETVVDELGWQGLIDYAHLDDPAVAHATWRRLGVTHVIWQPERGDQAPKMLAREAAFVRALRLGQQSEHGNGGLRVSALGPAPRASGPARIAWLGCDADPPLAIYTARGLAEGQPVEPLSPDALGNPAALARANIAIVRESCGGTYLGELRGRWERVIGAGGVAIWLPRESR